MIVNKIGAGAVCVVSSVAIVALLAGGCAHPGRATWAVGSMSPDARSRRFAECAESFRMDRKYCLDRSGPKAYSEDKQFWEPCMAGANRSFNNCIDGIE